MDVDSTQKPLRVSTKSESSGFQTIRMDKAKKHAFSSLKMETEYMYVLKRSHSHCLENSNKILFWPETYRSKESSILNPLFIYNIYCVNFCVNFWFHQTMEGKIKD